MSRFSNCRDTDLASTVRGCKCKCKRGGKCPCEEIYISGTQIHPDPGIENQLAITGGGPNGDEIPEVNASGLGPSNIPQGVMYWPSTSITEGAPAVAAPIAARWAHFEAPSTSSPYWKISTVSPRSGTYHMRWTKPASLLVQAGNVFPVGLTLCRVDAVGPAPQAMTAKVLPGDFFRVAGYARQLGGTDPASSRVIMQFYTAYPGLNPVGSTIFGPLQSIFGAYSRMELSAIAPATAAYVKAEFNLFWGGTSGSSVTLDFDDGEVEVT